MGECAQELEPLDEALLGVTVVPVVPMATDLSVDIVSFERHVRRLADAGITVFLVGGHTGEFYSLDEREARQLVEVASFCLGGHAHLIAGVGHDLGSAISAARHSEQAGCSAILVHQPAHPSITASGYVDYVARIGSTISIPLMPYISSPSLARQAIPSLMDMENVIAIKWGINDVQLFASCVETGRDLARPFSWVCGLAERWAPIFESIHPVGFSSGLANVHPRLALTYASAIRRHDLAAVRSLRPSVDAFELLRSGSDGQHNVSVIKEAIALLDYGGPSVRPPQSAPSAEQVARLKSVLADWKLLELESAIDRGGKVAK